MRPSHVTINGISFCPCKEVGGTKASAIEESLSSNWLQNLKVDAAAMSKLRGLVASHGPGLDLSRLDDDETIFQLIQLLKHKILCRCDLRIVPDVDRAQSVQGKRLSAPERVIRTLTVGDRPFSFEGQNLRVIRSADWRKVREDGGHRVVPPAEARQLLLKLAARPALAPAEKSAWEEVPELLAEAGAGRFEGLLLLRIVPKRNFKSPSGELPITPSQLARLVNETHWVEIELVDEDGEAVAGVGYSIVTPDNQVYTGVTDEAGMARIDNIPSGQCQISFPSLDKDAHKAA